MAVEHGAYCVGCCWVLMGLLFFGDVMYLYWIVGLTAIVLIKKTIPYGSQESYFLGAVLIVCGGIVLAGAFRLTIKPVLLSRIG
jgi:predicted metal-binding membrane protein